ncbi:hypothetical protein syc1312_d [Synechococcus elongatus PCC 6301]|uniref:DUF2231 domain-containing protein n=1 Tax=Synechococcus sp. (strain ATCC 27144 / PCC 6301 / SAUG 1402/1) TaxID=269084 RepID=A0A0H3K393_SYNP6|nr:DUF2231 domain-containing protein [Synechococcus elongatus]BAD79502.1 hypothetical protein syc1312_d [Synechococcus elongatus PCC 6301]
MIRPLLATQPDWSSGLDLGLNGLPYALPVHPNLVHFTIGLFAIALIFDLIATSHGLLQPIYNLLQIKPDRAAYYDLGWWNLLAAALITFVAVAFGFFEMLLAEPPAGAVSPWGLPALETMYLHGVGGVFSLFMIVLLTIWRGLERYRWRARLRAQVSLRYGAVALLVLGFISIQAEMGAQLGGTFGLHNTAALHISQKQSVATLQTLTIPPRTVGQALSNPPANYPLPRWEFQGDRLYYGIQSVLTLPAELAQPELLTRLNDHAWSADDFSLVGDQIYLGDRPLLPAGTTGQAQLYRLQAALLSSSDP